ncbi:MAG TPA: hypothetical protein VIT01_20875 [Acidimicrobiales bacterium]
MERRRALVVAGTVTATLAMAGTAMAVNLGLLGSSSDSVGDLTATDVQPVAEVRSNRPAKPRVRIVVQDVPVAATNGGGNSSTGSVESDRTSSDPAPTTAPTVDDYSDDDGFDVDVSDDDHSDDGAEDPEDPADDD